jgi:hypothetical protein
VDRYAWRNRRGGLDLRGDVGALVGLGQDQDGPGAALPGDHQVPLDAAGVEIVIEAADQQGGVDVGRQDLWGHRQTGCAPREAGPAWEDGADEGARLTGIGRASDPVANHGPAGRIAGGGPEAAGQARFELAGRGGEPETGAMAGNQARRNQPICSKWCERRREVSIPT